MRDIDPTASEFISTGYLQRSCPGGVFYDIGSIASIAAPIVGGLFGSDAAGDAAGVQSAAAAEDRALQQRIYEESVARQQPFYNTGVAANNRLSQLMGLAPSNQSQSLTYDQVRAQLAPQYARQTQGGTQAPMGIAASANGLVRPNEGSNGYWATQSGASDNGNTETWVPGTGGTGYDEAGLDAAVRARLAQQQAEQAQATQAAQADPSYGSLTRDFSAGDMASDPIYAANSGLVNSAIQRASNFETSPGYAFRLAEGQKGVENSAAARGGLLSGAAIKAIQNYGQNAASNEYNNWFAQSNTDRNYASGQQNDAYNRFNTDQTTQFNRLSALSGGAQSAAGQINASGANYANAAGNAITGGANAAASGIVGRANALSGGLSGAAGNYQQQNLLTSLIRNPQTTFGGGAVAEPYAGYYNIAS